MIRATQLTFFLLLLGQLIFAGVIYFLMAGNKSSAVAAAPIFYVLPIVLLLFMITLSWISNQYMKRGIKKEHHIAQKLRHYQQRVLLRLVFIETGVFAAGVFAMISKNPNLYLLMLIGIAVFAYFRPGTEEFVQDYHITAQEMNQLS